MLPTATDESKRAAWENVTAASRRRAQALVARDFAVLESLLSDDLRYTHATGVTHDRAGYLAFVRERLAFHAVQLTVEASWVDTHTVVLSGLLSQTIQHTGASERVDVTSFATEIWVDRDGWRLAVFQSTRSPAA